MDTDAEMSLKYIVPPPISEEFLLSCWFTSRFPISQDFVFLRVNTTALITKFPFQDILSCLQKNPYFSREEQHFLSASGRREFQQIDTIIFECWAMRKITRRWALFAPNRGDTNGPRVLKCHFSRQTISRQVGQLTSLQLNHKLHWIRFNYFNEIPQLSKLSRQFLFNKLSALRVISLVTVL